MQIRHNESLGRALCASVSPLFFYEVIIFNTKSARNLTAARGTSIT
jgi:hypothetical protein